MAKKFNFRLESVLKIRTEKVEETKNSLNVAVRNRYEKENEILTLTGEKKHFLAEPQIVLKASDMQATKDYMSSIDRQLEIKENEKIKLIEIEKYRLEKLNEALKEEKVIVKLKEKKLTEHQQKVNREETNFLDEVGTNQFISKFKLNNK